MSIFWCEGLNLHRRIVSKQETTTTMQVIWYDTEHKQYKNGSYLEFKQLIEKSPGKILGLERFNNIAESTVIKVVHELNKSRHSLINDYQ